MELPGSREKEGPQRRLMDVMEEDMQKVCVTEMDTRDRVRWRRMIHCGEP